MLIARLIWIGFCAHSYGGRKSVLKASNLVAYVLQSENFAGNSPKITCTCSALILNAARMTYLFGGSFLLSNQIVHCCAPRGSGQEWEKWRKNWHVRVIANENFPFCRRIRIGISLRLLRCHLRALFLSVLLPPSNLSLARSQVHVNWWQDDGSTGREFLFDSNRH